jgi:hypothetical protein
MVRLRRMVDVEADWVGFFLLVFPIR